MATVLPPTFDPARAVTLARAACAAYRDHPAEIADILSKSNLSGQIEPFSHAETEGFIFTDEDQCIVSFRGSVSVGDWVNNASIELVRWKAEGLVHQGFRDALEIAWDTLHPRILHQSKGRTLWFAGHSLGGALAVLAAMRLRVESKLSADGIYTFGMPKLGDAEFAAAVEKYHGTNAFTFLNEGDVVPWLPILPDSFEVACTGLRFDKDGRIQPRPGFLGAALLMLMGMMGKPQEEWLNLKAHGKEQYLKLVETAFAK